MPVTGDGLIIISRRLKAEAMCVKRLQRKTQIRLNPPYLIFSPSIAPNALTLVPFEPNIHLVVQKLKMIPCHIWPSLIRFDLKVHQKRQKSLWYDKE